jgi:hypothetical protein
MEASNEHPASRRFDHVDYGESTPTLADTEEIAGTARWPAITGLAEMMACPE